MDELGQMAERLGALETENKGRKDKERLTDFIGKHGAGFSNDEGIGAAILNKLDEQGIDTSAAIESAVEAILDDLRSEINAISSKINKVESAVEEAIGGETPPSEAELPPPVDMGAPPPDMGAPPPADMGAPPPPPPGGEVPPPGVVSDERLKKVQTAFNVPATKMKGLGMLSDERFKLIEEAIDAIGALPEEAAENATVEVASASTETLPKEGTTSESSNAQEGEGGETEFDIDLGLDEPDEELDEGALINRTLKGKNW